MTEEAIQEILEQTESDPAFQGVFDMFDFGMIFPAFKYWSNEVMSLIVGNFRLWDEGAKHSPFLVKDKGWEKVH